VSPLYYRSHRVCWWSVNDDDELPGHPRRSVIDVGTPPTADVTSTSTVPRDGPASAADVADYSQLNHVVRQSDVLKSVTFSTQRIYALIAQPAPVQIYNKNAQNLKCCKIFFKIFVNVE